MALAAGPLTTPLLATALANFAVNLVAPLASSSSFVFGLPSGSASHWSVTALLHYMVHEQNTLLILPKEDTARI